jgi:hypothetical protein
MKILMQLDNIKDYRDAIIVLNKDDYDKISNLL